ncbi:MAG: hypothetical protein KAT61_05135 [Gammaproteobacteria bacterium]|nr:hypothetical protein [Gammaproteobacteria bacterium]
MTYIVLTIIAATLSNNTQSAEFSGYIGGQTRNFFEDPDRANPEQHNNYLSAVAEPDFFHEWDDGSQNIEIKLFYREDQYDENRSHGDIRELSWTGVYEAWEVRAGISKVYWGVTETQHLVDIINQTDLVENVDGEDKLGQPMIRASTERDWGTLDFFILPGFRERTFAGAEGRPRPNVIIDTDRDADYDFSSGKDHIDFAARYSHYIDEWEFGLTVFNGVSREPTNFIPVAFDSFGNPTIIFPGYSLINQIGLDGQAFFGDWTWKLEATNTQLRSGDRKGTNSFRSVGGFEYTLVGFSDSSTDLGFVVEYHYSDKRIYTQTIFDNDLATALRFVFNDAQSSEILAGITTDADTQTFASFIEASRRLGESWTLEAQIRTFHGTKENRPLYSFRFDDFAQIDLNFHF